MTAIDGEFYINNANDDFYLRETGQWDKKGKLVRAHIVGLTTEGPFPFVALQSFELALSETDERFYSPFSDAYSSVRAIFPPHGDVTITLTDSLSGFLGKGSNVICSAFIAANTQDAVLTFNDVFVPPRTPLWVVAPLTADPTLAGLRCLFGSEPL